MMLGSKRLTAGSLLVLSAMAASSCGRAERVRVAPVFTDHMVLQRDMPVTVWGWAPPAEIVSVSIAGREDSVRTNADSAWKVVLPPIEAGGPHTLTVAATDTVMLTDVLIGDVWVASGQSNMEWPVSRSQDATAEIDAAHHPNMRVVQVRHAWSYRPERDFEADGWHRVDPHVIGRFSSVAYSFGRMLHAELDVPIGLIQTTWGGTAAEAWTSVEALRSLPDFAEQLTAIEGAARPRRPAEPLLSTLYNAMVAPLIPVPMSGVIWYQGESNADRASQYRRLFPAMIRDWRSRWGQGDFPFLFVQLANYMEPQDEPVEHESWPELREAQSQALALTNTAQVVTIDLGEANDIHPQNKKDVGRRLARAALSTVYGKQIVYSGPTLRTASPEGNAIRLHFDHLGGGLVLRDTDPTGFAVAAENRVFVWANATIDGETVLVSSPAVPRPVAVRYAWANNPVVSLYNRAGLPASPFRTDDWPGITEHAELPEAGLGGR